jgi:hypothetical protein
MGKMISAGAGAGVFDKLEPEPELEPVKNAPATQLRTTVFKLIFHPF